MGAIATGGVRVVNQDVVSALGIVAARRSTAWPRRSRPSSRAARRPTAGSRPPLDVAGATVILVDDGLATGSTMRAAVAALRQQEPGADRGRGAGGRALHPRRAGARGGRDRLRRHARSLPGRGPLLRGLRADERRARSTTSWSARRAVADAVTCGRRRVLTGVQGERARRSTRARTLGERPAVRADLVQHVAVGDQDPGDEAVRDRPPRSPSSGRCPRGRPRAGAGRSRRAPAPSSPSTPAAGRRDTRRRKVSTNGRRVGDVGAVARRLAEDGERSAAPRRAAAPPPRARRAARRAVRG